MAKKIFIFLIVLVIFATGVFYYLKHPKKADSGKKITLWTIQLKPVYEKQLNNFISDFEKKHKGCKVIWVDIPIQEAQKRTLASILSETPPDLVNLNPDFSLILAQRNALEFFSEEEVKAYHPGLVDKLRFEGKIYALPFYATSPVTIYNKEIYNKCISGKFIETYDELYSISDDIKTCSNVASFAASLNENDTLARILNKYNIINLKDDAQKEKAIQIYSMFDEMYRRDELPKDILTINHREVIEKYMSNQAAVIVAGSNFIKMIKQNAPDIYSKSALSAQLTGDSGGYDVSLMNFIIPKKAKNKALARELAYEITNKENQLELSKLTNVLSANKEALSDDFFKQCPKDLIEASRCLSAKQLDNLVEKDFGAVNKKTINEAINKTLEEILLDKNSCPDLIEKRINSLSAQLNSLIP